MNIALVSNKSAVPGTGASTAMVLQDIRTVGNIL